MTLPAYLLGLIYALLIGSLFHLWRDGGARRLFLYLVLSVVGAAAGQWVGNWQGWYLFEVGSLNIGLVTLGSLVFLGVGYWLSLVEIRTPDRNKRGV